MIINVVLTYRHAPTARHRATLDIRAWHAYRDAKGRLITPSHTRQLETAYPESITEGLRRGIFTLNDLLRDQGNPFAVAQVGDLEEAAWRLAG